MNQNLSRATSVSLADAGTEIPALSPDEQDAAGGIALSGRNRACARVRVLAGMVLTSGIVITLSTIDTSVSAPR
ncbi:hypothetical protein QQY24_26780 [Streptomyces sp. TG1A-8]|uniref:hypothetical protein n=1 Tax=Streptomyces sp. TG1A-8 TaxID=3051385 RepID=UPI00265C57F7|nr:hypothetical protein [Streptomyces sp. TG1A-8]MDO0928844.1 hypothetical protein [Streptomyces sp. TG1A-8]